MRPSATSIASSGSVEASRWTSLSTCTHEFAMGRTVRGRQAKPAATRLGRYFGITPQFWLNLQAQDDLDLAQDRASDQLSAITPLCLA